MRKNGQSRTMVVLSVFIALCGCAVISGVPQGSALIGVFEGSFTGKMNSGDVEVKLYRTPGGAMEFTGFFMEDGQNPTAFNGKLENGRMEGVIEVFVGSGILAGQLSDDGRSMSGTYKILGVLPEEYGTWNAAKK
jgi:hypothetical protein